MPVFGRILIVVLVCTSACIAEDSATQLQTLLAELRQTREANQKEETVAEKRNDLAKQKDSSTTTPETPEAKAKSPRSTVNVGDLVERLDDAVVFIRSQNALGESVAVGTGCVIDKSGLIATNRHVISDAAKATVQFREGKEIPVTGFVSVDAQHDLVLLRAKEVPDSVDRAESSTSSRSMGWRSSSDGSPIQR